MSRRCFSSSPVDGNAVALQGPEAHHLLHVLRVAPGDRLIVFDGTGQQFDAQVERCTRDTVELSVAEGRTVDRELPISLTLACAMPKGDRSRWLVEKAVELGVTHLVPLSTARSESSPGDAKAAAKWRRYVIEASKQCGRNRLMSIESQVPWRQWLQRPDDWADNGPAEGVHKWIAHPEGLPLSQAVDRVTAGPIYIAVGPEGGLAPTEIDEAILAGWTIVSLGPRILRIETAALALATALSLVRAQ